MILTGVELHPLRVILLIVMAVDTLSLIVFRTEDIVVDHLLIIVLQTALVDRQFLIRHIRRVDQSVADVTVDGVWRHMDAERLEASPLIVLPRISLHLYGLALGCSHKALPFIDIRLGLRASADYLQTPDS